jgi:hypothetical protein
MLLQRKRATTLVQTALAIEIARRLALHKKGTPGHSLRAISRDTKVARNTIRAMHRGLYTNPIIGFERCKCGHLVLMPCRICAARACLAAA